jgi:membrane-associated phospholipid phosphatase
MPTEQLNRTQQTAPARRLWSWLLLIGVIVLIFASFFFDASLWSWLRAHQIKPLLRFADLLSRYGDWPELMVVGGLLLAIAVRARSRRFLHLVICMIIASTLAGALVNTVRVTSGRPRPNAAEIPQGWYGLQYQGQSLLFKNKYHSFPSGHTAAAFGFFGVLAFARRRAAWLFLGVPTAIAWSRVYIGAHHLSDVLAGSVVGLFGAWITWTRVGPLVARWLDAGVP